MINKHYWKNQVGTVKWNGEDSVEQLRKVREKLGKEKFNLEELNNFGN